MKNKHSFTLIELMMMILILAILFAILVPQLWRSKEHAQVTVCMNNLRQVALGYRNYMHDFEGEMPVREYWLDDFAPIYMHTRKKDEVFTCPKSKKTPASVWDTESTLRNGDFLTGGTIEDIERNHNINAGNGNNPYHFDPSNPSVGTQAVVKSKRSARIVYEKYWGMHFDGVYFNVVHINDLHYEKEKNGIVAYWMLDENGWIETSLDPFPVYLKNPEANGDITVPPTLGDCTFCGGDGIRDNGAVCNKCGGDGWL